MVHTFINIYIGRFIMSSFLLSAVGECVGIPKIINSSMFSPERQVPVNKYVDEFKVSGISCMFHDINKEFPIIIHSHGNAGNIYDRINNIHHSTNASMFLYDYKGFGRSDDIQPTTKSILRDGEFILKYVMKNYPNRKIILMGESMGSSVAWNLASKYHVDGLIIVSGYSQLSKVVNNMTFTGVGDVLSLFVHLPDNRKFAKDVDCPILMIHGDNDTLIDQNHAKELSMLNKNIQLEIIFGLHNLCPKHVFQCVVPFVNKI